MMVIAWTVMIINAILCLISLPQVFNRETVSMRVAAFVSLMICALNSAFAFMVIF